MSEEEQQSLQTTDETPMPQGTNGVPTEPIEVLDHESGEMVERSPEEQRKAAHLLQMVRAATVVQAVALAQIMDGKHYLDLGYGNYREFVENELSGIMGYRQARKYVQIGRPITNMLPNIDASEKATAQVIEAEIEGSDEVKELTGMGVTKLEQLSGLDQPVFEEVVDKGKLVMPDGETEYTLEELKDMKSREVAELTSQMKMDRKAYRARIEELEAEKEKLESEKDAIEEKAEEADEKIDEARDIEAIHGEAHRTLDGKRRRLAKAREKLAELRKIMLGDGFTIEADDPDSVLTMLQDCFGELNAITDHVRHHHPGLEVAPDEVHYEGGMPEADFVPDDELDAIEEEFQEMAESEDVETVDGEVVEVGSNGEDDTNIPETPSLTGEDGDAPDMDLMVSVAKGKTKEDLRRLQEEKWMFEPTIDDKFRFTHRPTGKSTDPHDSLAGAANEAIDINKKL
jgi:hypothetical protein